MIKRTLKATNLTVTTDTEAYLDKRLEALEKFIDADDTTALCAVELERDAKHQSGDVYRAEYTLSTRDGLFRAEERGETIESAIDQAKDTLVRELRRTKRKRLHLLRRSGARMKAVWQGVGERGRQWFRRRK